MKPDRTNYQNGFNFYFDWPVEIAPGVNVPVEMRAFIEPDESVGCTDWYVANVYVAETDQEITKRSSDCSDDLRALLTRSRQSNSHTLDRMACGSAAPSPRIGFVAFVSVSVGRRRGPPNREQDNGRRRHGCLAYRSRD
jgi:hypothetical protein